VQLVLPFGDDQVLLVDPTNMVVADILHDYVLRDYEKKK